MRQMHDYKSWRFGLTALERDGRWTARIEVYEPGKPSREYGPLLLPFTSMAASEEEILVVAAETWIDRHGGA
jgi:hypothetical protein